MTTVRVRRTGIADALYADLRAKPQVNGIVLHRTESSTAASTLSTWRSRDAGTGAHFLIDVDGTIHQTVSLRHQAWHVGRYRPATQRWDDPTPEQTAALGSLMESLQRNFGLTDEDVYEHDAISRKTPGEGAGLYTPAALGMDPGPAGAGRMPAAAPQR